MKRFAFFFVTVVFLCLSISAQSYTIQQYLNIKSSSSPAFSPDGKRLAYLSNDSGLTQIWMADLPGSGAANKPRMVTSYDDNVSFVRWSPGGNGIVFGKGRGGDENIQLFWMANDGVEIKELTKDPKVRHNFGDFSADGTKIYYASNKRNRNFFDIYQMELASGKEELIYQFDGNNDFAAVDSAGTKIIVNRDGTELSLDNNLYLYDLKTKKETLLTPHKFEAAQFGQVHFVADGLIYAQNDRRNFYSLSQMRLKNAANKDNWSDANREVTVLDEAIWDVGGIEMNHNGGMIAYTVNYDGFSELYLRKVETGGKPLISNIVNRPDQIKLPAKGVVGGMAFSRDEKKLAFSFSSAKYNTDIWLYDFATKKLTQITNRDRAGISQDTFIEPELIRYKSFDGTWIPAWYYFPMTGKVDRDFGGNKIDKSNSATNQAFTKLAGKAMPVIISVHGGPEAQERPGFNPLYQYYLSRGYAVLATNVRGSTGYGKEFTHMDDVEKREDSVKDLAAAVDWLKASGGADPKRIAVMGGSYGGYMTMAAITLYPELFAAAVNTVGIVNWETFLLNTSGYRRRQREVEYGRLDRDIDFLRRISPMQKIDKIKAPLFVIHGKNDPRVPYTEAEQVVKALKDRGVSVQYKLYDDEGHGISKLKNRLDLYPQVADFLDKHMK